METIFVTAPMPPALEQRARMEAARRRISRAELVRQAVAEFLQQIEAQATPVISGNPQQEADNAHVKRRT